MNKALLLLLSMFPAIAVHAAEPVPRADGFRVELSLENGHLATVIFGMSPEAKVGFDREGDSPAPPPGHGTGYTAFVLPDTGMFLYRDIKPPGEAMTWTFLGRVHPDKPIRVQWDKAKLPAGYHFAIQRREGTDPVDMRETTSLTLQETEQLKIIATTTKRKSETP